MILFHGFGGGPPWEGRGHEDGREGRREGRREEGRGHGHEGRHGGRRGGWFMQPPIWGFLQPCLLLLLQEGPKHGYRLIEELEQKQLLGGGVDIGNLYRTLHKMEMMDLVEVSRSESGHGPNKKVYQITERGSELLEGWATALEQRTSTINRFLNEYHRVFGESKQTTQFNPFDENGNDEDFI